MQSEKPTLSLKTMRLRDYQQQIIDDIRDAWSSGARVVCAVLPTAAGKTVCFSKIAKDHSPGVVVAIAHRQELVEQMSLALGRWGVYHQIMAPRKTFKHICNRHMTELGHCWQDPSAPVIVAGVRTLNSRGAQGWHKNVTLWIMDECHHILQKNEWGRCVSLFPNAKGLGVTATPTRSDGKGLGSHADGVIDAMVEGPSMRDLIQQGHLTDYRIICPPSNINLDQVSVSQSTGDYVKKQLSTVVHESTIVGDAITHYRRFANGKRAVAFCVDVLSATETAAAFNNAGIVSAVVSAKTPDNVRTETIRRFRDGEILVIANVDLFGEGFDLPAIEATIMLRPTQSYGLYVQQFGRALRLCEGKTRGVIIDHVGNVVPRHGLPDAPRVWTLDRRDKRARNKPEDVEPLRVCGSCLMPYDRALVVCPHCGDVPKPQERAGPEQVDGDLMEISAEKLAEMRGEVERIDGPPVFPHGASPVVKGAIRKRHAERQEMQGALRGCIKYWLAFMQRRGHQDRVIQKRFYIRYGVDLISALALGKPDASKLADQLCVDIGLLHQEYGYDT